MFYEHNEPGWGFGMEVWLMGCKLGLKLVEFEFIKGRFLMEIMMDDSFL